MAVRLPACPEGFDPRAFFEGVYWHQKWQLFEGVFTPGINSIEQMADHLGLPANLAGKRVLDIGAWNGCLSFECERRGAREVVALGPEDPKQTGFDKLRDVLGSTRVRYVQGSVYDLNPQKLGYFDVVLFCGVLYHLRYPLLGIDNIRRVCGGEVLIETFLSEATYYEQEPSRWRRFLWKLIAPSFHRWPVWQFYRTDELNGDPSNWFGPNAMAVVQAFESAGFDTVILKHGSRGTFRAIARPGSPEYLSLGCTESVYYDQVSSHLLGHQQSSGTASTLEPEPRSYGEELLIQLLSSDEAYLAAGHGERAWENWVHAKLFGQRPASSSTCDGPDNLEAKSDRRAFIKGLISSTDYRTRLVQEYYRQLMCRVPTAGDVQHWVIMMQRGASADRVLAEFLASPEFFTKSGAADGLWLKRIYEELLDKPLDDESQAYLEALAENSSTRPQIVLAVIDSLAYRSRLRRVLNSLITSPATLNLGCFNLPGFEQRLAA